MSEKISRDKNNPTWAMVKENNFFNSYNSRLGKIKED